MKVKIMFMLTAQKKPAVLVSSGNISLGINHPSGPHDHAKPDTKKHIKNNTTYEYFLGKTFVVFKNVASIPPVTLYKIKQ